MKIASLFFAAASLLAVAPVSAHAKIVRVVEKSFTVQPGGLLTVETQGGDVRVESSDQQTVKVVATQTISSKTESGADELLTHLHLKIEQQSEGVRAIAKYEKAQGFRLGSWPPVRVSFVVTVPSQYNVKLNTSGGNITVGDLNGKVNARTSGGDVNLDRIRGDVDAGTSGGDVRLKEGLGIVKLNTSGGNVSVDRAVGQTDLSTSGGNISVGTVEAALHASTSGGNVTAGFVGALKGDCHLDTSGGNVRASVSPGTAFNLDASTSGGHVRAEGVTVAGEGGNNRSRLTGKVNGGGPLLKLRSSGGDIVVTAK